MRQHRKTWLVFGLAAGLLFAAVSWVSLTALRLESAQWTAGFEAAHEEAVRLALWRLDSSLTPLVLQEGARPAQAYAAFHAADRAYTRAFAALRPGDILVPSPLLESGTSNILLHFQLDALGRLTSPQFPQGNARDLAEAGYTTRERIEAAAVRLGRLRGILDSPATHGIALTAQPASRNRDVLRQGAGGTVGTAASTSAIPTAQAPATAPALLSGPLPFSNRASPVESPASQRLLSTLDQQARLNIYSQGQGGAANGAPFTFGSGDVVDDRGAAWPREGWFKPVWLGDDLVLARHVELADGTVVQGCWLDWPGLQRWLLASIHELLPGARLEPVTDPTSAQETRLLATLPVRLVPASAEPGPLPRWTPVRVSLAIAWVGVVLAALAVGVLLQLAMSLSDRRGAFVSAVTHELRSPLTTFRMYSEMLAEGMVPEAATRQIYLDTLCAEAARLSHLVENVLAFAGLERGSARRQFDTLALEELLARVQPRLCQRAGQAGLGLVVEPDLDVPGRRVRTDVSAVEQILFNLVDNAGKYAAPGAADRRLHLEVGAEGRFAVLRVRDHGPGISDHVRRRLFRPFSKSAPEAARSAPGVGLGLALSRRLSRSLGGDLRLEQAPGEGACLALRLPFATGLAGLA